MRSFIEFPRSIARVDKRCQRFATKGGKQEDGGLRRRSISFVNFLGALLDGPWLSRKGHPFPLASTFKFTHHRPSYWRLLAINNSTLLLSIVLEKKISSIESYRRAHGQASKTLPFFSRTCCLLLFRDTLIQSLLTHEKVSEGTLHCFHATTLSMV